MSTNKFSAKLALYIFTIQKQKHRQKRITLTFRYYCAKKTLNSPRYNKLYLFIKLLFLKKNLRK